jgi:predicted NBD/HSP70 family sugar kinase
MSATFPHADPLGEREGLDVLSARTRSRVFAAILSAGPMSRTQVARATGLSPSTVTKVVGPLVAADYLVELGADRAGAGAGRPQVLLAVNYARHAVIGVKLHPDHVTGVLADVGARVLARRSRRLRKHAFDAVIGTAADLARELLEDPALDDRVAIGIGVGVGGHIDRVDGLLIRSAPLGWENVDIAGSLTRETGGHPAFVSNDLDALAIAERRFGRGRDVEDFAVVSLGAGVGCGLVLRGELYTGSSGMTGEIGHMPMLPDGPLCRCGNRGCLEAIASDAAIRRMTEVLGGPRRRTMAQLISLAGRDAGPGGEAAREAFRVAGDALGRALAILCNVLNLQRVILSGEGVVAYELLRPSLESAWRQHSFSTAADDCDLVVDHVDDDLWARGAACLVIDHALQHLGSPFAWAGPRIGAMSSSTSREVAHT